MNRPTGTAHGLPLRQAPVTAAALIAAAQLISPAWGFASDEELASPVRITTSDGKPIDVEVGHAAPFYGDIDGDGVKDLLVGQFGEGKLRIYRNIGTNEVPTFDPKFQWLKAGGGEATVPYG